MIAARGFAAVGLNYSTAPERQYPDAVHELNDALGYLVAHAEEFHLDRERIILAGDSAGAQLASQLAVMVTNAGFAAEMDILPAISSDRLHGAILNCGVNDLDALSRTGGIVGWGFKTALWAYAGKRDWSGTPAARHMATVHHVTVDIPASYISGGNGDELTVLQSMRLADTLAGLNVPVTRLLWNSDHKPALPHEYQFRPDRAEAHAASDATLKFIASVSALPRAAKGAANGGKGR
jgi:acetyl esterase/lipase